MKLGVSSYCFRSLMTSGEMDLIAVLDWVAASPAEHIEIAAMDGEYYLENENVVRDTAKHAEEIGVPIVNYLVSGDLRTADSAEVDRLRRQLDIAHAFGATIFRVEVLWGASPWPLLLSSSIWPPARHGWRIGYASYRSTGLA